MRIGGCKRIDPSWICVVVTSAIGAAALGAEPVVASDDPEPVAVVVEEAAPAGATSPEAATSRSYAVILARNPFDLRPPPPPPEPEPPKEPEVAPDSLKLTGITTLLGSKRAMFVLQEPKKDPVYSDLVREGEKDTSIPDLEVTSIDEIAGRVEVILAGKPLTLDFVNNGIAPESTAAPSAKNPATAAAQLAAARARAGVAVQTSTPTVRGGGVSYTASSRSGLQNIPRRPTRLPTSSPSAVRRFGGGSAGQQDGPPPLTPQQQILAMKAQEELARMNNVPLPPAPPVPQLDAGGPPGIVPPAP